MTVSVKAADGPSDSDSLVRHKHRYSLNAHQRLHRREEFQQAFNQGPAAPGRYMVMWRRRGEGATLRLGVVASKRTLRRAVDRARAKRMLREVFRLNRYRFQGDVDVVLVVRRALLRASFKEVERDLLKLARRTGLLMADPKRTDGPS